MPPADPGQVVFQIGQRISVFSRQPHLDLEPGSIGLSARLPDSLDRFLNSPQEQPSAAPVSAVQRPARVSRDRRSSGNEALPHSSLSSVLDRGRGKHVAAGIVQSSGKSELPETSKLDAGINRTAPARISITKMASPRTTNCRPILASKGAVRPTVRLSCGETSDNASAFPTVACRHLDRSCLREGSRHPKRRQAKRSTRLPSS